MATPRPASPRRPTPAGHGSGLHALRRAARHGNADVGGRPVSRSSHACIAPRRHRRAAAATGERVQWSQMPGARTGTGTGGGVFRSSRRLKARPGDCLSGNLKIPEENGRAPRKLAGYQSVLVRSTLLADGAMVACLVIGRGNAKDGAVSRAGAGGAERAWGRSAQRDICCPNRDQAKTAFQPFTSFHRGTAQTNARTVLIRAASWSSNIQAMAAGLCAASSRRMASQISGAPTLALMDRPTPGNARRATAKKRHLSGQQSAMAGR